MTVFDKIPTWLKTAIVLGIFAIGPVMLIAFMVGGSRGGIVGAVSILVYFMVLYIVGIRRYSGDR